LHNEFLSVNDLLEVLRRNQMNKPRNCARKTLLRKGCFHLGEHGGLRLHLPQDAVLTIRKTSLYCQKWIETEHNKAGGYRFQNFQQKIQGFYESKMGISTKKSVATAFRVPRRPRPDCSAASVWSMTVKMSRVVFLLAVLCASMWGQLAGGTPTFKSVQSVQTSPFIIPPCVQQTPPPPGGQLKPLNLNFQSPCGKRPLLQTTGPPYEKRPLDQWHLAFIGNRRF
jgi:hypothetical protein